MEKKEGCPFDTTCTLCGFRRDEQCRYTTELENTEAIARVNEETKKIVDSFKALIGHKIVEVIEYTLYHDSQTLIALVFDDGRILTAEDGEYGDNNFRFTTKENLKTEEEE